MEFNDLSDEIKDKIFLYLDYDDLCEIYELCSDHVNHITEYNCMIMAVQHGNLENMKWLLSHGHLMHEEIFFWAADRGDLTIMKWLLKNNCPWDLHTFSRAVINGNLDNMKWLHVNHCPWNTLTFGAAAVITGDVVIIAWLFENRCPYDIKNGFRGMIDLEAMRWVRKNIPEFDKEIEYY